VLLVALVALGCSNGSASPTTTAAAASSTTSTTSASTTAAPTSAPTSAPTTSPPTAPPTTLPAIDPASALLNLADLPTGYVASTPPPPNPNDTLLCGTPPVQQVVPAQTSAEAAFQNDDGAAFLQQTVSVYPDAATAQAAVAAGRAGVACGSGTNTAADGSVTTFQVQEQLLPVQLGDESMAYAGGIEQGGEPFSVLVAAVRAGRAVTALQLVVLEGGVPPDPVRLLELAAARLQPA
jgi:hypothetical protein